MCKHGILQAKMGLRDYDEQCLAVTRAGRVGLIGDKAHPVHLLTKGWAGLPRLRAAST